MEIRRIRFLAFVLLQVLILTGCSKNLTNYFPDGENNGLGIFSNTGNNLMTCYVNGAPWRTFNRTTAGFFSPGVSEVHLYKKTDSVFHNMLVIQWDGTLASEQNGYSTIMLCIAVGSGFSANDISDLAGKRISVDSTNGYFTANIDGYSSYTESGHGSIYFNRASFDSTAPGVYTGELSGLLEADFADYQVTSGRFDHNLTTEQVGF